MSWPIVGVSALAASTGGDITLTEPAGVTSGNLMVAALHFENNDPFTKPTGWEGPFEYINTTTGRPSLQLFYIERGGSAPDLTFTRTGGNSATGFITAYEVTGTLALSGTPVVGPTNGSGATSFSISGLTTDNANDLLFVAITGNSTVAVGTIDATDPGTASGSVDTSTDPTAGTWIARYAEVRSVTSSHYVTAADAMRATAGATGNITAASGSNTYATIGILGFTQGAGGSGDTIDTDEFVANRVIEGASGSATVTITGSHTGATDDIEVQIEETGGGVVVAWTTLDSAVAAGAFSGTVSVPRGGWYVARTRKASDTPVSNVQSNRWGVGIVLAAFGQSHMEDFYANGTGSSNDLAVVHNGSAFAAMGTTGAGQCAMADALVTAADCPVCFIATGVSGTAISYWWSSGKTANYDTWEAKITAAGGELSAFALWQGDANAQAGTTESAYKTEIDAVFAQLRSDYGAGLPVVVAQLGRKSGATDSAWEAIRDAHVDAGNDAGNYLFTYLDQPTTDGQHLTDAGHEVAGERLAQCVAEAYGDAAYSRGPVISSASYSGAVVTVTLSHDTGTDFTPTTGITGFRVLDNGTPGTISSAVRTNGTTVTITMSGALSGPVTVQYGYGADPDYSDPLLDNTALTLPLQTTDADITASGLATSVTVTLTGATSLTGLKWAFWDEVTPNLFSAPVAQGSAETTDGSDQVVIDITGSALASGATGFLLVTNSDGTTTQMPQPYLSAGPVVTA